ncbi:ArsI/CadI family heavy metal resistance metalloenzyme [Actinomadura geliboluensis]|uniref:ArsI/CadI family heavy metal resistance metalloenzyme n=1 Tax=Actinomadura geliboluensis TaxID=882440 RepID=UPI0026176158|nr:ArsI/CadI family heavy metal resistance metalloenzyme [Actinomadura geliboluensis]
MPGPRSRPGVLPSVRTTEPAKRRPGYANFAVAEPPLKLVLIEGKDEEATRMDHLGVEVEDSGLVTDAAERLTAAGLATFEENDTSCCHALQDKVWVTGPGKEPWEVYVVKADADTLEKAEASACCTPQTASTTSAVPVTIDIEAAEKGTTGSACC